MQQEALDEQMLKTGTVPVSDAIQRLPAAANGESKTPTRRKADKTLVLTMCLQSGTSLRRSRKTTKRQSSGSCRRRWPCDIPHRDGGRPPPVWSGWGTCITASANWFLSASPEACLTRERRRGEGRHHGFHLTYFFRPLAAVAGVGVPRGHYRCTHTDSHDSGFPGSMSREDTSPSVAARPTARLGVSPVRSYWRLAERGWAFVMASLGGRGLDKAVRLVSLVNNFQ